MLGRSLDTTLLAAMRNHKNKEIQMLLQNNFNPIGYLLLRQPTLQIICWDICETEMASQRLIGLPKKAFKKGLKNSLFDVQKRGNTAAAAAVTSLKFDDFKSVYQFKSTKELMRSYSILRLCGINFFVDNSLKVSWINSTIYYFFFFLRPYS